MIKPQVELFCIDHLVMVTVEANDEFLFLDLAFPTTKLHGRGTGDDATDDVEGGLNGMEAAFQVLYATTTTIQPTTTNNQLCVCCHPICFGPRLNNNAVVEKKETKKGYSKRKQGKSYRVHSFGPQ